MAKTKTKQAAPKVMSDTALEIVVWPLKVKLRCDHAGARLEEDHEPDVHDEPTRPDAAQLVRHRYETKCEAFGKVEAVEISDVDDPARACPKCGFLRSIVEAA